MTDGVGDVREPWVRRRGETARAYDAFRTYRDLGPKRSLRAAAEEFYGRTNPGSVRQMERWSRQHGWRDRVAAWDDEQDRIYREEAAEALRDMADRHARIATSMLHKVVERLRDLEPSELSPRDMSTWANEAARLERLARGEATETVEHRGAEGGQLQVVLQLPEKRRPTDEPEHDPDTDEETHHEE